MAIVTRVIDLTEFATDIDNALADGVPCIIATDADGQPDLALKGSFMVFDRDHLAFLERSHGVTIENLRRNPRVAVLYRNSSKRISARRFYGEAEVYAAGEIREQIRARTITREIEKDPENRGIGVLIRIDRVIEANADVIQQR